MVWSGSRRWRKPRGEKSVSVCRLWATTEDLGAAHEPGESFCDTKGLWKSNMGYVFDLSGSGMRKLQFFPDAGAAFQIPATLEKSLSLLVWGVVYPEPLQDADFCKCLPVTVQSALPTALYLSGWGVLTFHDVQSGSVTVWPYEPTFQLHHLRFPPQSQGEPLAISQNWSGPTQAGGVAYLLSMILEQPLGFMALKVVASGPVTLSVSPHDFITEEQLAQFPERYRFDLTRTRQLQSLLRRTDDGQTH